MKRFFHSIDRTDRVDQTDPIIHPSYPVNPVKNSHSLLFLILLSLCLCVSVVNSPSLLLKSALIASLTALIAVLLALPCALFLCTLAPRHLRRRLPLLCLPLFFPPYVLAIAWLDILGANGPLAFILGIDHGLAAPLGFYSPLGLSFVQALSLGPIPMLAILLSLRQVSPQIYDAARLNTQSFFFLIRFLLPLARPGIYLGGLVCALLSWTAFAVPSLLQTSVYTVEIHTAFMLDYDPSLAFFRALPLVAIALILTLAIGLMLCKHPIRIESAPNAPCANLFNKPVRIFLLLFTLCLGAGGGVLPLVMLLIRALPLTQLFASLGMDSAEFLQSMQLALATASCVLLLSLLITCFLPKALRSAFALLSLLPFPLTGPIWGVALITLFNRPGILGTLYDSPAILVISLATRYLWVGVLGLLLLFAHQSRTLNEAAANCGAKPLRRFFQITLPLHWPHFLLLWGIVYLLAWGDLDSIVLLAPPGWTPLPLRLFTLMHYGPSREVATLSLFSILGAALPFALFYIQPSKK